MGELEAIPYKTQRKRVRYPLCPPADIYVLDDAEQSRPQPCQLLNISTGGVCIVSEYPYHVEQTLRLEAELVKNEGDSTYHCRVVRVTPRWGGRFEYGLLFVQLDGDRLDGLTRAIHAMQEEKEKKLLL